MDELWTFVGNKKNETWISYMIDRVSKQVVDYKVGARTKENLNPNYALGIKELVNLLTNPDGTVRIVRV
jgi:IS1 family transposase